MEQGEMKKITYIISFSIGIALICSISYGMPLPLLPDSVQPLDPEEIAFYFKGEEFEKEGADDLTKINFDVFSNNDDSFSKFKFEKESFTAFLWNLYKTSCGMKESDLRNIPNRLRCPEIHWTITKEKRNYTQLTKLPQEVACCEHFYDDLHFTPYTLHSLCDPPFLDNPKTRFQVKLE